MKPTKRAPLATTTNAEQSRFLDVVRVGRSRHRDTGFLDRLTKLSPAIHARIYEVEDKVLDDEEPLTTSDRSLMRAVLAEADRLASLPPPSAEWTPADERDFRKERWAARASGVRPPDEPRRPHGVRRLQLPGDKPRTTPAPTRTTASTPPAARTPNQETQPMPVTPSTTPFMARARAYSKEKSVSMTVAMKAIAAADPALFDAHKRASVGAAPAVQRDARAAASGR